VSVRDFHSDPAPDFERRRASIALMHDDGGRHHFRHEIYEVTWGSKRALHVFPDHGLSHG
jgi:hypothetical protein